VKIRTRVWCFHFYGPRCIMQTTLFSLWRQAVVRGTTNPAPCCHLANDTDLLTPVPELWPVITNKLTVDPPTRIPELTRNWIRSSHGHSTPSLKISCKSVQPFSRSVADKERKKDRQKERKKERKTDRQTERKKSPENNTYPRPPTGGGVNSRLKSCPQIQLPFSLEDLKNGSCNSIMYVWMF